MISIIEHFSGKNGTLRWSILVGKQKDSVQKLSFLQDNNAPAGTPSFLFGTMCVRICPPKSPSL